jgi:large conductance mechanosensitive channel
MIKEFREFLFRGNIVELAVAVVIAAAFGAVITALVKDIITPILSLFGVPNFSTWVITVNGLNNSTATFAVGDFINVLIAFVLIAIAIFFIVVKPVKAMEARRKAAEAAAPAGPSEIDLLTDIRDTLRAQGSTTPS